MLPIIVGLLILGAYFEIRSSTFLSAGNLTNLFIQSTVFILLGMAEIWLLLLGDIDLSAGWIAAVGAAIGSILLDLNFQWPWWAALLVAMGATTAIGTLQGFITIALKVPSFIITLGGSLFWEGIAIYLIDGQNNGGSIEIKEKVLYGIVNINMSTMATWIVSIVAAAGMSFLVFNKDRARRSSGLDSVTIYETFIKIAALFGLAIVLILIFNTNRGTFIVSRGHAVRHTPGGRGAGALLASSCLVRSPAVISTPSVVTSKPLVDPVCLSTVIACSPSPSRD